MSTRLAILWHMHQPPYLDVASGEQRLPWVRMHATHSYTDMAAALEAHPRVKCTVNFSACLLDQLDEASRRARPERFVELTRRHARELSAADRATIVRQFFMASRERIIHPSPRYTALLKLRGGDSGRNDAGPFSEQDLRDLQVHFNLGWMGHFARTHDVLVRELAAKDAGFTEDEKHALLDAQQRFVDDVMPRWKHLAGRRQVEVSTTPYAHPILPLLCDTDVARRAMPNVKLPTPFRHPSDAAHQVHRAIETYRRVFGDGPRGMWPAEGSVSPEALEIFAKQGISWVATDEGNLGRSVPAGNHRGIVFQPWQISTPGGSLGIAFRDHLLSDRVGFDFARRAPADAAREFVQHVRHAAYDARQAGVKEPLVSVILDGENAWEHFPQRGAPFLDALYAALEQADDLHTVTMAEALSEPSAALTTIHSGSWIDSNFRIWIGHPEDNLAWELLGAARAVLAASPGAPDEAWEALLGAEASDWFWWYGDDFQTDCAADFDLLFRNRLLRVFELCGKDAPPRLHEPVSAQARAQLGLGPARAHQPSTGAHGAMHRAVTPHDG